MFDAIECAELLLYSAISKERGDRKQTNQAAPLIHTALCDLLLEYDLNVEAD